MKYLVVVIFLGVPVTGHAGQSAALSEPAQLSSSPAPAGCECRRCIAVYGDSRTNHDIHAKIAALIKARAPRVILHTGDLVSKGADREAWARFLEITKDLRASASFYAVLGNHEAGGEKTFMDTFHYPGNGRWYSVETFGVRFLMLDYLSPLEKGTEQYKWLQARLASTAPAAGLTVAVVHKPLISSGRHWDEKWKAAKDLEALLRKYKAAAVLAGHDHDYERLEKDGLVVIVAGGGGAPLRDLGSRNRYSRTFTEAYNYTMLSVCGGKLKGESFDIDDRLIDAFAIPPAPVAK